MSSKTGIANRCLAKIGETRVSNIDTDSTKKALIIKDMWDSVRDSLLELYPWNFAITRTQLALDGTSPSWGYSNRYLLPTDFLSLLSIQNEPDYIIEGGYILTDSGAPLYIRYIRRVTSTGDFTATFDEAFAATLAVECVEAITQSNTKKQILMAERDVIISAAYASDAIQDLPQELRTDSWITAREHLVDEIDYNV